MSEIRLEDISINSLKETHPDSKCGAAADGHANSLQQSSTSKATLISGTSENGQPSNPQNVQKAKDKTDKEIANLTSIILNEKEPASKLKFTNESAERPSRARCVCLFEQRPANCSFYRSISAISGFHSSIIVCVCFNWWRIMQRLCNLIAD